MGKQHEYEDHAPLSDNRRPDSQIVGLSCCRYADVLARLTKVRVLCPHCGGAIITFIEYESSWVTYTAAVRA